VESCKLQYDGVTTAVWHYKCDVLFLSTNLDPRSKDIVEMKVGRGMEKIKIQCNTAVANYICYMWGVDLSDQLHEYYGVGRSSKK
jgi:hypothetical protein